MHLKTLLLILILSGTVEANLLADPGVLLEVGGAPTLLFSDSENQAFGLGFGHQVSLGVTTQTKSEFGLKLRVDRFFSRQEVLNRASSYYLTENTRLKSMSQQYVLSALGGEWRSKGAGHTSFYEALLGYALGVNGVVETTPEIAADNAVSSHGVNLENRFFVMFGAGAKRPWIDSLSLVASARTFFIIGSPYADKLEDKYFVTLPFLLLGWR